MAHQRDQNVHAEMLDRAIDDVRDAAQRAVASGEVLDPATFISAMAAYAGSAMAMSVAVSRVILNYEGHGEVDVTMDDQLASELTALCTLLSMSDERDERTLREEVRNLIGRVNPHVKLALEAVYGHRGRPKRGHD